MLYCGQKSNYINKDSVINISLYFKEIRQRDVFFMYKRLYNEVQVSLSLYINSLHSLQFIQEKVHVARRRNNAATCIEYIEKERHVNIVLQLTRQLWMVPFACTCAPIDKRLNNFAPFWYHGLDRLRVPST